MPLASSSTKGGFPSHIPRLGSIPSNQSIGSNLSGSVGPVSSPGFSLGSGIPISKPFASPSDRLLGSRGFEEVRGESLDLSTVFGDDHAGALLGDGHAVSGMAELSTVLEDDIHHDPPRAASIGAGFETDNSLARLGRGKSLSVFTDDSQAGSVTSDAQTLHSLNVFESQVGRKFPDRLTLEREVFALREQLAHMELRLRSVTAERDSLKSQLLSIKEPKNESFNKARRPNEGNAFFLKGPGHAFVYTE